MNLYHLSILPSYEKKTHKKKVKLFRRAKKQNNKSCTALLIQVIHWCQQTKEGASFWHNSVQSMLLLSMNRMYIVVKRKDLWKKNAYGAWLMKKERILLAICGVFFVKTLICVFFHNSSTLIEVLETCVYFQTIIVPLFFNTRAKLLKLEDAE